jgi:hypothetical protein
MSALNPMGINGPNKPDNHTQADYRTPASNPNVASTPVGNDLLQLNLTKPPAHFIQPGIGNFPF